jgi:hypothetical protein
MVGKIFITRQGYDPQLGKHVKDPYLGPNPATLGHRSVATTSQYLHARPGESSAGYIAV